MTQDQINFAGKWMNEDDLSPDRYNILKKIHDKVEAKKEADKLLPPRIDKSAKRAMARVSWRMRLGPSAASWHEDIKLP